MPVSPQPDLSQPAGYSSKGSKSTLLHRHTETSTLSIKTLIGILREVVKLRTLILNSEQSLSIGRHPRIDLSAAAKLTVHSAQNNDETKITVQNCCLDPGNYTAIADRTLGRCGFNLLEVGEDGFVIM